MAPAAERDLPEGRALLALRIRERDRCGAGAVVPELVVEAGIDAVPGPPPHMDELEGGAQLLGRAQEARILPDLLEAREAGEPVEAAQLEPARVRAPVGREVARRDRSVGEDALREDGLRDLLRGRARSFAKPLRPALPDVDQEPERHREVAWRMVDDGFDLLAIPAARQAGRGIEAQREPIVEEALERVPPFGHFGDLQREVQLLPQRVDAARSGRKGRTGDRVEVVAQEARLLGPEIVERALEPGSDDLPEQLEDLGAAALLGGTGEVDLSRQNRPEDRTALPVPDAQRLYGVGARH